LNGKFNHMEYMKNIMRKVALILICSFAFIAGCTANGPVFSRVEITDDNKAVVYLYRPFSVVGCGQTPWIYIDDIKQGQMKNNGYIVYFVEPGKRMIEVRDQMWDKSLTLYPDLEGGKEYYIRFFYESKIGSIETSLAVIPPEYALQEINRTKKAD
jgi:hypothetical protein